MTHFAKKVSTFVLFAFIAISLFQVIDGESVSGKPAQNSSNVCLSRECVSAASRILNNVNSRADPCDDFYEFACGTFAKTAVIPDAHPMVDAQIKNRLLVESRLQEIIELIDESTAWDHRKYIKILYNNCMKSEWTPNDGRIESWQRLVNATGGWPLISKDTWNVTQFKQQTLLPFIFHIGYQVDLTNASNTILGISTRDPPINPNYLRQDFSNKVLTEYWNYMTDVAHSLGVDKMKAAFDQLGVVIFDIHLYSVVFGTRAIGDRYRQTTRTTLDELDEKYPKLGFRKFLRKKNNPVIQMSFDIETLDRLNQLLSRIEIKTLANWAVWRITTKFVKSLNRVSAEKTEAFHHILQGRTEKQARWRKCVAKVRSVFDLSLAASYHKYHLDQNIINDLIKIFENVKQQFTGFVEKATWLENGTRKRAVEKIQQIGSNLVACRELISDVELESYYDGFELADGSLESNKKNITRFLARVKKRKLLNPRRLTAKDDCGKLLLSDDVYEPSHNYLHFVFELYTGALYNIDQPKYLTYGTIGSLMGQRISSAIDELGRNFNGQGALEVWWNSESIKNYKKKTQCFVDQYENYFIDDSGLKALNGLTTQKENVADNVGAKAAYHAFVEWANETSTEKQLPGLDYSSRQMFWVSMASTYCSKYRPEYLESRVIEDTRAPHKWRVNGPVSNLPEFAVDFKCRPGSRMNPVNKCHLW